jgi:hypothetical protein
LSKKPVKGLISVHDDSIGYDFPSIAYTLSRTGMLQHSISESSRVSFIAINGGPTTIDHPTATTMRILSAGLPVNLPLNSLTGASPRLQVYRLGILDNANWGYEAGSESTTLKWLVQNEEIPTASSLTIYLMPSSGDQVSVTYYYNPEITNINTFINSDNTRFIGQDILVREAQEAPIDIYVTVQSDGSLDENVLKENIKRAIEAEVNVYQLAYEVHESDIIATIKDVQGVTDVKIPLDKLSRTGETGTGDILVDATEYPVAQHAQVTVLRNRVVS